MRVVNTKFETITEYDLSKGYLRNIKAPKEDAIPLGTEIVVKTIKDKEIKRKKRTWNKEDLEEVQVYIPFIEKTPKEKVDSLKTQLSASDYKIIKCMESYLAGEALPYDITELHAERDSKRAEINKLEEEAK